MINVQVNVPPMRRWRRLSVSLLLTSRLREGDYAQQGGGVLDAFLKFDAKPRCRANRTTAVGAAADAV